MLICNIFTIPNGGLMNKRFVVITEIYFNDQKISRSRVMRKRLKPNERNQLIRTLFNQLYGLVNIMDIYSAICVELSEKYEIIICERTVMRALKEN
jgi:hypothetical protein